MWLYIIYNIIYVYIYSNKEKIINLGRKKGGVEDGGDKSNIDDMFILKILKKWNN